MKSSHHLRHTLYGIALLSVLLLTACSSQTGTTNKPTPTPTTPPPTPTSTPTPAPTPTPIPGTPLGGNLIVNGNAEQGQCAADASTVITPIPGWTPTGQITPIQYAASGGDLDATTPAPSDAGNCYFWGGPSNASSSMTQTITLTPTDVVAVATNTVVYDLSAWLGGYEDQNDNAVLAIQFLGATNNALGTAKIGPVLAVDRDNNTELLQESTSGPVPVGTRSVVVTLTFTRTDGSDNDGLADDLSLILIQQSGLAAPSPTTTPTPAS